jgi:hypothetical protein
MQVSALSSVLVDCMIDLSHCRASELDTVLNRANLALERIPHGVVGTNALMQVREPQ